MSARSSRRKRAREGQGKDEKEASPIEDCGGGAAPAPHSKSKSKSKRPKQSDPTANSDPVQARGAAADDETPSPGNGFLLVWDPMDPAGEVVGSGDGEKAPHYTAGLLNMGGLFGLSSIVSLREQGGAKGEMPAWCGFSKVGWHVEAGKGGGGEEDGHPPSHKRVERVLVLELSIVKPLPGEDAHVIAALADEELVEIRARHAVKQGALQVRQVRTALAENLLAIERNTSDETKEPDDLSPLIFERQRLKQELTRMGERTQISFMIERGSFTARVRAHEWTEVAAAGRNMSVCWVPGILSGVRGMSLTAHARVPAPSPSEVAGDWAETHHVTACRAQRSEIVPGDLVHGWQILGGCEYRFVSVSECDGGEGRGRVALSAPTGKKCHVFDLYVDELPRLRNRQDISAPGAGRQEMIHGVAISKRRHMVVRCSQHSDEVGMYQGGKQAPVAVVKVSAATNVAVDDEHAFVVPWKSGGVTVISLSALTRSAHFPISVRYPSIAVDEEHVFVASGYGTRVEVFTKTGHLVREIPIPHTHMEESSSNFNAMIAVDDDHMYVSDGDRGIVSILHKRSGELVRVITGSDLSHCDLNGRRERFIPFGIAVCDGRLFVCEKLENRLHMFTCPSNQKKKNQ